MSSIYFSQNARFVLVTPSDWPAPGWFKKGSPSVHSHYLVKLGHSPHCHAQAYGKAVREANVPCRLGRNFKVAACVVCEDSEGRFLLTRRERNMGFFARAWVFPGGHIEVDEGLDEGALREFREETGIEIEVHKERGKQNRSYSYKGTDVIVEPFFAFESTTRYNMQDPARPGPPNVAHLIIFFKMRLSVKCSEVPLNL